MRWYEKESDWLLPVTDWNYNATLKNIRYRCIELAYSLTYGKLYLSEFVEYCHTQNTSIGLFFKKEGRGYRKKIKHIEHMINRERQSNKLGEPIKIVDDLIKYSVNHKSELPPHIIEKKDITPDIIECQFGNFLTMALLWWNNIPFDDRFFGGNFFFMRQDELQGWLTQINKVYKVNLSIEDVKCFLDSYEIKSTLSKKRKRIKGTVRQNVLMRDNYTCQICGKTVKDGAKLEIDHIIPVSKGGTNNESNLQVLCRQCNREKHNRTDLLHDKLKLEELNNEVKL